MVGRLAAQNALRNPRRTGATASALMIGLALMSMMSIFGSSASASTDAAIGKSLTSQFIVSNVVGQPFSTDVAEQVRRLDGVSGVTQLRSAFPELKGGGSAWTVGVDPKAFGLAFAVPTVAGSFADLGPGTVAISAGPGEGQGLRARRHRHDEVPGARTSSSRWSRCSRATRPCRATTWSRPTPWRRAGWPRWTRWSW